MVDNKQTKTIGEHFACANLARHGWAPALTRDGVQRTDILAVGAHLDSRPTVEIQVKTATGGGPATSWILGGKAQLPSKSNREWFVLVALPPWPHPMRSFVVPRDHVAAGAWVAHMTWLRDPNVPEGTRNVGPERARIRRVIFEGYEDRWDLLSSPTNQVPVLLPTWIRDRCQNPDIGLPMDHPWWANLPEW
jgi:hypothetical protein